MARHKACLVAKRFIQVEGINFNETFSLIARMESIWVVFVVVAITNLKMYQMNVKIAFLNGDFLVQICICNNHKAYGQSKFKKYLYGLKQLPCKWNPKIKTHFLYQKFERSYVDHNVYFS
jgi:hypothetical protein